ncbi:MULTISPECIES: DinI-like family protein [Klebsiella pneumoniae complex]|uniref:DinI-like family protein n=1 Tax=Klebsiella pneumoniae complex TaxID=3390273 RepID=UPI000A2697EB|nr:MULTISPECIES: DinI-like family protein [Klebsiella]MCF1308082.1 DinI-like family protein [Klebsiella quasipneumoniae]MCJ3925964.1 DinI-like family protein [Klebsiella pneumoniae]MCJ5248985.1 DinI-like family protein [Klebsiella quasipneumoniae]MCQ3985732.1 DinI family protein [Klebsiella pneumoniae]RRY16700.1 DinI family protein [Klebsiella quasipneumoniae]
MRVEISIAKEKAGKMPKGSLEALKDEMTRRVSKQYDNVEVIVKTASNDGLSVMRVADKEIAKEFVEETLQNAWETADDWFVC